MVMAQPPLLHLLYNLYNNKSTPNRSNGLWDIPATLYKKPRALSFEVGLGWNCCNVSRKPRWIIGRINLNINNDCVRCIAVDAASEQYRAPSSAGFEPISEEFSASDPYIARAQAGRYRPVPVPLSDHGTQVGVNRQLCIIIHHHINWNHELIPHRYSSCFSSSSSC